MGQSTGKTFYLYLLIYFFIFDWREKSQHWTQVSVDKTDKERKN